MILHLMIFVQCEHRREVCPMCGKTESKGVAVWAGGWGSTFSIHVGESSHPVTDLQLTFVLFAGTVIFSIHLNQVF